jgi:hypothetical protein
VVVLASPDATMASGSVLDLNGASYPHVDRATVGPRACLTCPGAGVLSLPELRHSAGGLRVAVATSHLGDVALALALHNPELEGVGGGCSRGGRRPRPQFFGQPRSVYCFFSSLNVLCGVAMLENGPSPASKPPPIS